MTREQLRDYVDEQRTLNNIPYHVYSTLIDGIDTLEQEPTTKNDLEVEKIVDVLGSYTDLDIPYKHKIAEDILNNLSSVTLQEPRWIPVSERLPEWDIECLVVDDKGEFGVGFYRDDVGAWDSPSWGWLERKDDVDNHDAYYMPCGIGKVVAWMPLPTPYEPQKSEE